ncbi:amino acid ABC transporter permease [Cytobacillus oceanisediminis]|uniref:Amino acid ABC transporter permease n=2 Tax=Niallia TaxID=2837506 RepID=A0A941GEF6_NIACI|nr:MULTISPECIES: amino acid ABC transporter permease [Bacillaceae]MBQ6448410.1 amino acid ABC transporter permease [Bacillus sp. (in: firmicutes)]MDU1847993.1 amino acid ABC transporter permease [Niallia nealsonii]MBZ9535330.1 amino acid ABC transporter permease [Cytobacillus oceanisediminis]MCB5237578.1 amino acid ABC transporter permease [Niallia circulans]MED3791475.1 amino acid ABC transporter permease [Niallia alba]
MDNIQLNNTEPVMESKKLNSQKKLQLWLKNNLFKDWKNAIVTIITLMFTIYLLTKVGKFLLTSEWGVVTDNLRLLFVGQFPMEEIWRLWVALLLLSVLLGTTWGAWRGIIGHVAISLSVLFIVFGILPYTEVESKIYLFSNVAAIILFYFVGKYVPKVKVPMLALWILFIPITLSIINGFGVLEPVKTNIWGGFLLTLVIASVAIICSFPLGLLLAVGRRSKLPLIKYFCILYIELIRGMPLIMVLFIAQLLLPMFLGGIQLDNVVRAMIAFTLFSAAYLAENIRGGLQSVPRGQFEAAQALGLSNFKLMVFIVLPQALKAVIPAMVGQFISVFKDTSLVAVIGLADFLGMGKKIAANPAYLGKYMELYIVIAFMYFIFCFLMSHVSKHIEKSLGVGTR